VKRSRRAASVELAVAAHGLVRRSARPRRPAAEEHFDVSVARRLEAEIVASL
jgi:hypothetical protein